METDEKLSQSALNEHSKKLIVYFSHPGENYNVGYIEKGNTHIIADMIADATGADIFEIVPEKGYPKDDYNECITLDGDEELPIGRVDYLLRAVRLPAGSHDLVMKFDPRSLHVTGTIATIAIILIYIWILAIICFSISKAVKNKN